MVLGLFLLLCHSPGARGHVPHDHVADIAMSPAFSRDGTAFAVVRGSLFRSVDGGFEWRPISRGIFCDWVSGVAVSPAFTHDRTVFLWCDSTLGRNQLLDKHVYRSEDAGRTWGLTDGAIEEDLATLIVSPRFAQDRTLVAMGKSGGLFRSVSLGGSWEEIVPTGASVTALTWAHDQLVLGTNAGVIYTSIDSGTTWTEVSRHSGQARVTAVDVLEDQYEDTRFFVGTESDGVFALKRSDMRFRRVSAGIADPRIMSLTHFQHKGELILLATTWKDGVYRSEDLGVSWRLQAKGLKTSDQADELGYPHFSEIAVSQDGTSLLGSYCGVFRSDTLGREWYKLETTLGLIVGLDVSPADSSDYSVALATYGAGMPVWADHSASWTIKNTGLPQPRLSLVAYSPHYTTDSTIFTGSYGWIFRSTDGGSQWRDFSTRPRGLERIKVRALKRIRHWFPILTGLTSKLADLSGLPPTPLVFAISPTFDEDRTLFAGMHPNGIFRSQDGGATFVQIWDSLGEKIRSLAISPDYSTDGTLFVGLANGVYRTRDRGHGWETVRNDQDFRHAVVMLSPAYEHDRTVFVGSISGLFRSRDGGETWEELRLSESRAQVSGLAVSPTFETDGRVLAQVRGGELFVVSAIGEKVSVVATRAAKEGLEFSSAWSYAGRESGTPLIKFSPRYNVDHTVYAASMQQFLKSTDGGENWVEVPRPMRYEPELAFAKWFIVPISTQGEWSVDRDPQKYSSSAVIHASEPGSRVTLQFVGTGVDWIGTQGPEQGRARVFIDGELRDTVDQYARKRKVLVRSFSATGLTRGPHTLTIDVLGSGSEQSEGTRIHVDAFDVER